MVRACGFAITGQLTALLCLVATEVLPVGAEASGAALQAACALEACGYGLGAVAALAGVGLGSLPVGPRAWRALFSLVLWGLAVRHAALTFDPMLQQGWLSSGSTWGGAFVLWLLLAGGLARQSAWAEGTVRWQAGMLSSVVVLGAINTVAMAARRSWVAG